jgi:hypothetical protein
MHYIYPCTNINFKWIKGLNISPEALRVAKERAGKTNELIGIGNEFLNGTQIAQHLREKFDKLDYMKLKIFFTTKEMFSKLKKLPMK